jgi:hypothetical protein
MKKTNFIKILVVTIIVFITNYSFAQYKTTSDIGSVFKGTHSGNYVFTDFCFWCIAGYGLARFDNLKTEFYQFDSKSVGNISRYSISSDSVNIYDDRISFNILQTNNNDVWLISDTYPTHLLLIKYDRIFNYTISNSDTIDFKSFYCDKDSSTWFHFTSKFKDSLYNYLYFFKNDSLQLKNTFNTSFFGETFFFKLSNEFYISEVEYFGHNKYYYSLFKLNDNKKEIFYRFEDKDNNFDNSSHYIYNNELYILKENGELLKINDKKDVKYFDLKVQERHPSSNFLVVGGEFIYPTSNYVNKINLINGKKSRSEYLAISENCKSVIKDIFLSRDGYIYCSLRSNEQKGNMIIDTPECKAGNNLKIVRQNF